MKIEYKPTTKREAAQQLREALERVFGCPVHGVTEDHPVLVWVLPIEVCLPLMDHRRPDFGRLRVVP